MGLDMGSAARAEALSPQTSSRPLRAWQQAALSMYWFATNAHWTAILITLLPLQAELIGGADGIEAWTCRPHH